MVRWRISQVIFLKRSVGLSHVVLMAKIRSLNPRQQFFERDLPLSEQRVSLQTGAFVHHFHLDGQVLHLRYWKRVKVEVLVEDGVAAVLDDRAPLFLEFSRVQV